MSKLRIVFSFLIINCFFEICRLDFKLVQRANAEHMSPSGRVPFVRAGQFVVADLDHIINFVRLENVPYFKNFITLANS